MTKRIAAIVVVLVGVWTSAYGQATLLDERAQRGVLASATTLTTTAANHEAGNALICGVFWLDAPSTFVSVANTGGDTWQYVGLEAGGGGTHRGRIYYTYNIAGHASDVITFTFSAASVYKQSVCYEMEGLDTSGGDPFIAAAIGNGSGTSLSTSAITIATDAIVFAFTEVDGQTFVGTGGFTSFSYGMIGEGASYWGDMYKFVTGTTTPTGTAGTGPWRMVAAAFKAAPDDGIVYEGESLQSAIDNASVDCTDVLLEPAATFVGNFTIPGNNCTAEDRMTIATAATGDLPPDGTNLIGESLFGVGDEVFTIERTDDEWDDLFAAVAAPLPKIISTNQVSPLRFRPEANYITLDGLEVASTYTGGGDTAGGPGDVIGMGSDDAGIPLDDHALFPTGNIIKRSYVHGVPTGGVRRGITCNAIDLTVQDSIVDEVHQLGAESQAIACAHSPGPLKVYRNWIAGASMSLFIGGGTPSVPGTVTVDVDVRGNYMTKRRRWFLTFDETDGIAHVIKNNLEYKNVRNSMIVGNLFEYNIGGQGQSGFAILMTPLNDTGTCTWCEVTDVTFDGNIIRHIGGVFMLNGQASYSRSDGTRCDMPGPNRRVSDWHNDTPAHGSENGTHLHSSTANVGVGGNGTFNISGGGIVGTVSRTLSEAAGGYPYGEGYVTLSSSVPIGNGMTIFYPDPPSDSGDGSGCVPPMTGDTFSASDVLIYDHDPLVYTGSHGMQISSGYIDITLDHLTMDGRSDSAIILGIPRPLLPTGFDQMPGLVIKNSFFRSAVNSADAGVAYGIAADSAPGGAAGLNTYTPDADPYVWSQNVFSSPTATLAYTPPATTSQITNATFEGGTIFTNYSAKNYRVVGGSPYKAGGASDATDGEDVGADIDAILTALHATEGEGGEEPPEPGPNEGKRLIIFKK